METCNRHNGSSKSVKEAHALVLTFPMQGHITPLLQLSHRLSFNYGFLITFVISHDLCNNSQTPARYEGSSGKRIRMVSLSDGLPLPDDPPPKGGFPVQEQAMDGMRPPVEELLRSSLAGSDALPPITHIISDIFVTWSFEVATSLSLPLAVVMTTSATSGSVLYHTRSLLNQGILPLHSSDDVKPSKRPIDCIPGVLPLSPRDLPSSMPQPGKRKHHFLATLEFLERVHECECLLFNTVYELEAKTVDSLRQKIPAVYTVGPLLLPASDEEAALVVPDLSFWQGEGQCLAWLDKQPPSSVMYVSFGSISKHSDEQLRELALGLEASEQPFMWVIRRDAVFSDKSVEEVLPEGFLERTRGRGLITPWAPQLLVLSHRSVGGFLSHCGWNSILENISISGVPMLCWPDKADQMDNRRVVVEEWAIGLDVRQVGSGKNDRDVVGRQEVERAIRQLFLSEEGKKMRLRATQLRAVACKAVRTGGSSYSNMEAFVQRLHRANC